MSTDILSIVVLSLRVSGLAVAIASVIGIPLGVMLGVKRFPGRHALVTCTRAGMAMPPVVIGLLIYILLSRSGPLGSLGWLYTETAMVIVQTILALPFVISIVTSSIEAVPIEMEEQLRSLGATPRQTRWTLLREARFGVLLAIAAALGRSLSEVGAVLIVGGNISGHTRVLTTAIVLQTSKAEFGTALLLGAILVGLALSLNFLLLRLQQKMSA